MPLPFRLRPVRLALALCLSVGALASVADAQTPPPFPDPTAKGRVAALKSYGRDGRLTKTESAALAEAADAAVFGRLLAGPTLTAPHGFSLDREVIVASPTEGLPAWAPSTAKGYLLLRTINTKGGSKPDGAGGWIGTGEGPSIKLAVNDLAALFHYPEPHSAQRPGFQQLPVVTETRGGFMVLRFRTHDHIVIAKPGRLPWRHVTKQEVLEREIADRAQDIGKLEGAAAPALLQTQAEQKAELAALPPAERAAKACRDNELRKRSSFAPCSAQNAYYVVAYNPDYFDRALPRTALQLVVVSEPAEHRDADKRLSPIARAAVRGLDLAAIQRSLR